MTLIRSPELILRSPRAGTGASAATTVGKAYFTYLRFMPLSWTLQYIRFWMQAAGTGADSKELGLFYTPLHPNRGAQNLVKITSTNVVDSILAAGPLERGNTNPFNLVVAPALHIWAGFRPNGTTGPTVGGFVLDQFQGWCLETAGAAAFSTAGPWAGAIPTTAVGGGALNAGGIVGLDMSAELV